MSFDFIFNKTYNNQNKPLNKTEKKNTSTPTEKNTKNTLPAGRKANRLQTDLLKTEWWNVKFSVCQLLTLSFRTKKLQRIADKVKILGWGVNFKRNTLGLCMGKVHSSESYMGQCFGNRWEGIILKIEL